MRFLKRFLDLIDFQIFTSGEFIRPNVSYIKNEKETYFFPKKRPTVNSFRGIIEVNDANNALMEIRIGVPIYMLMFTPFMDETPEGMKAELDALLSNIKFMTINDVEVEPRLSLVDFDIIGYLNGDANVIVNYEAPANGTYEIYVEFNEPVTNSVMLFGMTSYKILDLTDFDNSQNELMVGMFMDASLLEEIIGLKDLNVEKCKGFSECFGYNYMLKTIDLSNWKIKVPYDNYEIFGERIASAIRLISDGLVLLETLIYPQFSCLPFDESYIENQPYDEYPYDLHIYLTESENLKNIEINNCSLTTMTNLFIALSDEVILDTLTIKNTTINLFNCIYNAGISDITIKNVIFDNVNIVTKYADPEYINKMLISLYKTDNLIIKNSSFAVDGHTLDFFPVFANFFSNDGTIKNIKLINNTYDGVSYIGSTFIYANNLSKLWIADDMSSYTFTEELGDTFFPIDTIGTFYYNEAYDYSHILEKMPETWSAIPCTLVGDEMIPNVGNIITGTIVVNDENSAILTDLLGAPVYIITMLLNEQVIMLGMEPLTDYISLMKINDVEVEPTWCLGEANLNVETGEMEILEAPANGIYNIYIEFSKPITNGWHLITSSAFKTLDLTHFDNSQNENMSYMFMQAPLIEEIIGIENLNVEKSKSFVLCFGENNRLKTIDLSKWNITVPFSTFSIGGEDTKIAHLMCQGNMQSLETLKAPSYNGISYEEIDWDNTETEMYPSGPIFYVFKENPLEYAEYSNMSLWPIFDLGYFITAVGSDINTFLYKDCTMNSINDIFILMWAGNINTLIFDNVTFNIDTNSHEGILGIDGLIGLVFEDSHIENLIIKNCKFGGNTTQLTILPLIAGSFESVQLINNDYGNINQMYGTFSETDSLTSIYMADDFSSFTYYEVDPSIMQPMDTIFPINTEGGIFYYNGAYDYSTILSRLPENWTAVPCILMGDKLTPIG